mgnify:CR=1 FL=1
MVALATDLSKLYIPLNFASDKSLKVAIFNLVVASSDQFFLQKIFQILATFFSFEERSGQIKFLFYTPHHVDIYKKVIKKC